MKTELMNKFLTLCVILASAGTAQARIYDTVTEDSGGGGLVTAPGGLCEGMVLTILMGPDHDDSQRGWLGVRLDVPGPALAAQLGLEQRGLLVMNVCEGSPADRAGLQQYDVIVNFGGQDVSGDLEELGRRIRELGPGAEVELTALRRGNPTNLKTTLAACPDESEWIWRYKQDPQTLATEEVSMRGKIMKITPGGGVIMDDVPLGDVPPQFWTVLPKPTIRSFKVWNEDGSSKLRAYAVEGDVVLQIERDSDGRIHVCRMPTGEQQSPCEEKVYQTEEAMKSGDELAYKVLKEYELQQASTTPPLPPGSTPGTTPPHVAPSPTDASGAAGLLSTIQGQDNKHKQELLWRSLMPALEQEHRDRLKEIVEDQAAQAWEQLQERWYRSPQYSFEVAADGSVIAVKRKGDSELRWTFPSLQDMEKRNPGLYDRYRALQSSEEALSGE